MNTQKILVLSDTHIPRAAHDLPKEVYEAIGTVDMILHAGDFVERDLFHKLSALKETKAVYGNMDPKELRDILNPKDVIRIGRFKIGLIHGYGPPRELISMTRQQFSGVDAIVFGHSHAATNIVKDGVLFFNPGSPTDKIFAAYNSYGILEVGDKSIEGRIIKI
jgi:putative phosphoesterase